MNLNKVMIGGTLVRDPDLKYTSGGTAVTKITLAINRKVKDNEEVAFVNVVLWAKRAELVAKELSKGKQLVVEGRLKTNSWEKDGVKKSVLDVIAENIHFVGKKGE